MTQNTGTLVRRTTPGATPLVAIAVVVAILVGAVIAWTIWRNSAPPLADRSSTPIAVGHADDYGLRHAPFSLRISGPYDDLAVRWAAAPISLGRSDDFGLRHAPVSPTLERYADYGLR